MSTAVATWPTTPFDAWTRHGVSRDATWVQEAWENVRHGEATTAREAELASARAELRSVVAEYQGVATLEQAPVNEAAAELAEELLASLPTDIPMPEFDVDPDGGVALDWFGVPGKRFSISLDGKGRLFFAGVYGRNSTRYGREVFGGRLPKELLDEIRRALA